MNEYVLSICINYYKRITLAKQLIKELLKCDDPRLQIVLYDDSSDDQMKTYISAIEDSRLKWVRSSAHKGMVHGMLECISVGDGIFSLYTIEREMFDVKKLPAFMDDLEHNKNVGAGCSSETFRGKYKIYKKGVDAVENLAIQYAHPVGYFFNTAEYKKLDIMKYDTAEKYGNFPFDFLMGEMLANHDGMIYESVWYVTNDHFLRLSGDRSFTMSGDDCWFMLKGRKKILGNAIEFVEQLPLSTIDKSRVLLRQFEICENFVSLELKQMLAKEELCKHYFVKERYLGYKETVYNLLSAYCFFCRNIPLKYHRLCLDFKALKILVKYLIREI